jgi:hypothetical protein
MIVIANELAVRLKTPIMGLTWPTFSASQPFELGHPRRRGVELATALRAVAGRRAPKGKGLDRDVEALKPSGS